MTPALKGMLDEPGNDLIVIPFHRQYSVAGFVPVRTEDTFHFICRSYFTLEGHEPGSCIQ